MIINLYDLSLLMPVEEPNPGVIHARYHLDAPIPVSMLRNAGFGRVELMRVIAPQTDTSVVVEHIRREMPFLKALFSPTGVIEIYGRPVQLSNTIGGALGRDLLNTIGGASKRDLQNTIGGALSGDLLNTIGGALRQDVLNTIGGALRGDILLRLAGSQRVLLKP